MDGEEVEGGGATESRACIGNVRSNFKTLTDNEQKEGRLRAKTLSKKHLWDYYTIVERTSSYQKARLLENEGRVCIIRDMVIMSIVFLSLFAFSGEQNKI